jgi:hypothetical protein
MDWESLSKETKRKFTHLIILYEEIDVLRSRESTPEIEHAISVLKTRCKEVREELSSK